MYVPTGVRAEFPEALATVRSESGAEVQGRMAPIERTVWYGNSKASGVVSLGKQALAPTAPLVGWSEQDVRQSGVYQPEHLWSQRARPRNCCRGTRSSFP
jgi:hypothetical protein